MGFAELALDDLTDELVGVFRDPAILIGIPLAILGAVFMSFGAQYQHRGVQKVERLTQTSGGTGLTGGQLVNLLRRPSWVAGTLMLGLAIVSQLLALSYAPLIHSESVENQELQLILTEGFRRDIEEHVGEKDPGREILLQDLKDLYGFPRLVVRSGFVRRGIAWCADAIDFQIVVSPTLDHCGRHTSFPPSG